MDDGSPSVNSQGGEQPGYGARPGRADPTWRWPVRSRTGRAVLFVVSLGAYAAGSQLALLLIERSGLASVFFIPAGITLGLLLRVPKEAWWLVVLAAGSAEATMDLLDGYSIGATAGFVAANTIEPVIGALLVSRRFPRLDLARRRQVWWFFVAAVVTAPAVGAAIGSVPASILGESDLVTMFWQWWLGDALGVLLVGGGILVWGSEPDRRPLLSLRGLVLVFGTLALTIGELVVADIPLMFLVLIGVVVAGAVFGCRAVAVTGLVVASTIAVELAFGSSELITGLPERVALVVMKLQLGVFTLAGLVVGAEVHERERATAREAEARNLVAMSEQARRIEHRIAVRLQEELLPDEPVHHPQLAVAARYEAGGRVMLVGGDWYDVFALGEERIGLTVGDVVGHGLEASASMGHLRTAVSVLAAITDSPSELLTQLDGYVARTGVTTFATACYAVLDLPAGVLTYASAGHPPMLTVRASGATRWLDDGLSPPLLPGAGFARTEASVRLEPGCLLLAYSDGLVERREEDLRDGLARLEHLAREARDLPVEEVCDRIMDGMGVASVREDDVVVAVLRYGPGSV